MAPNGHQGRLLAPPGRTHDVSDAHGATVPEELEDAFLPSPVAEPAATPGQPLIGALMTGRGLVLTTIWGRSISAGMVTGPTATE